MIIFCHAMSNWSTIRYTNFRVDICNGFGVIQKIQEGARIHTCDDRQKPIWYYRESNTVRCSPCRSLDPYIHFLGGIWLWEPSRRPLWAPLLAPRPHTTSIEGTHAGIWGPNDALESPQASWRLCIKAPQRSPNRFFSRINFGEVLSGISPPSEYIVTVSLTHTFEPSSRPSLIWRRISPAPSPSSSLGRYLASPCFWRFLLRTSSELSERRLFLNLLTTICLIRPLNICTQLLAALSLFRWQRHYAKVEVKGQRWTDKRRVTKNKCEICDRSDMKATMRLRLW